MWNPSRRMPASSWGSWRSPTSTRSRASLRRSPSNRRTVSRNPRSTVGTVTEVYDYLRLLWARVGVPHCTECGRPVLRQSASQIVERLLLLDEGAKIQVLAPLVRGRKGEFRDLFEKARKQGFVRAVVDGERIDLSARLRSTDMRTTTSRSWWIAWSFGRRIGERLADSVETALRGRRGYGGGRGDEGSFTRVAPL